MSVTLEDARKRHARGWPLYVVPPWTRRLVTGRLVTVDRVTIARVDDNAIVINTEATTSGTYRAQPGGHLAARLTATKPQKT